MKDIYIKKMTENIKEQTKEYQKLLKCCENKRKALVLAKMEELDSIITEEEELIRKLGAFELERLEIQKNLAQILNIPVEDMKWETLSHVVSGQGKIELEDATAKLRKVIEDLSDVNHLNQKLLEQSLRLVRLSMNTITGENEKTYSKTTTNPRKGGKILDIKA